uniref:Uncharacterized protein n=1 Tax=Panagrolaimus sp. PS1159 TaxID=55785 RepID=A0AC35FQP7_9BILA
MFKFTLSKKLRANTVAVFAINFKKIAVLTNNKIELDNDDYFVHQRKSDVNLWSKSDENSKKSDFLILPKKTQNRWQKGISLNDKCDNNKNSTLSLHISAYETFIESESHSKFNKAFQPFFYEIPRQQNDLNCKPEVMQYKSSQKLLNLNEANFANNKFFVTLDCGFGSFGAIILCLSIFLVTVIHSADGNSTMNENPSRLPLDIDDDHQKLLTDDLNNEKLYEKNSPSSTAYIILKVIIFNMMIISLGSMVFCFRKKSKKSSSKKNEEQQQFSPAKLSSKTVETDDKNKNNKKEKKHGERKTVTKKNERKRQQLKRKTSSSPKKTTEPNEEDSKDYDGAPKPFRRQTGNPRDETELKRKAKVTFLTHFFRKQEEKKKKDDDKRRKNEEAIAAAAQMKTQEQDVILPETAATQQSDKESKKSNKSIKSKETKGSKKQLRTDRTIDRNSGDTVNATQRTEQTQRTAKMSDKERAKMSDKERKSRTVHQN